MTHDRDIERLLDLWLADGPTQSSDHVFDETVARIHRQSQRPAWLLRRELPMSSLFKVALVAAAAIVIAVAGFGLIRPSGPGSNAGASLSPTPTLSVSPSPSLKTVACEDALPCLGALKPGRHFSGSFDPKVFYQTPQGWANSIDIEGIFKLDPSTPGDPYVLLWSGARITMQTPDCTPTPDPARGTTASDWISFIQGHPGLVASAPVSLPLSLGTTMARAIDVAVSPDWTATCPVHGDLPYVMLLTAGGGEYGLPQDARLHVVAFDVDKPTCNPEASSGLAPDPCQRRTVVSLTYGLASSSVEEFVAGSAEARQIIETFEFGCGPGVGRGPCGGPGQ